MKKIFSRNKSGFTLIEIVMVNLILGIIVAVALPNLLNLATQAKKASTDAVAESLKEAIRLKYLQNVTKGTIPFYPTVNPFTLLQIAPSNKLFSQQPTPNGIHWRYRQVAGYTAWYIFCPYYNGNNSGGRATKGRFYIYQYGNSGVWNHKAGDLWLQLDRGY